MEKDINQDLLKAIRELINVNRKLFNQQHYLQTFFRGLFSALGQTIGLLIVLSALIYILNLLGIFHFFAPYISFIEKN